MGVKCVVEESLVDRSAVAMKIRDRRETVCSAER